MAPKQRKKQKQQKQKVQRDAVEDDVDWEKDLVDISGPKQKSFFSLSSPFMIGLICAIASICLYWNTHTNLWAYDDRIGILRNHDALGHSSLKEVFENDFWGTPLSSSKSHKSYRPLTVIAFRFNTWMHGTDPASWHVWNNIYNVIAVVGAVVILGSFSSPVTTKNSAQPPIFLLVSSLLFTFHPIHTEVVANIVGRAEILGAIMAFAAFFCHQKCLSSSNAFTRNIFLAACCTLAIVSSLFKENGLMVLAICGAGEIASIWIPAIDSKDKSITQQLLPSVVRFIMLALTGMVYFGFRKAINGPTFAVRADFLSNPLLYHQNGFDVFVTAVYIQAFYFWRLVYPFNLLSDYGYNIIPIIESMTDPRNLFTLVWLGLMLSLIFIGLAQARRERDVRILSGLAWIFGPLLPASHILPIGTVLAERLLYMPSLGYAIIVGVGLEKLNAIGVVSSSSKRSPSSSISSRLFLMMVMFVAMLAVFAQKTLSRNVEWNSNETLFEADFQVNPNNAKAGEAYCKTLYQKGEYKQAWEVAQHTYTVYNRRIQSLICYAKSTAMYKKDFPTAYTLLDEAIQHVHDRPKVVPFDHEVYIARGYLLTQEGKFDEAREWYIKSFEEAANEGVPNSHSAICSLGQILARTKSWEESLEYTEKCIDGHKKLYGKAPLAESENLGKIYYMTKRYDKAEEIFLDTLKINPDDKSINAIFDDIIKRKKRKEAAEAGKA